MTHAKCKILVVDKKGKYPYLFSGFRKHRYVVSQIESLLTLDDEELTKYNLFCVILYEIKDLLEVLKNYKANKPIIIASDNSKMVKKIEKLKCFSIVDLTQRVNTTIQLHEALTQSLNLK